jgi:hypothetical protein
MGMWLYTKRTLLDYLHRPCIRRGQLSRFLFWVPWEVFHTVLCLIIYIGRTSFGGDSYRVFFLGSLWSFSHGTLPDYVHRRYIFRRGELSPFFSGFPGKFEWFEARWRQRPHRDSNPRPWGSDVLALSRWPKWLPSFFVLAVLCLIIYIVRTSFAGESYRVFFSGFPEEFFTRNSAWLFTSSVPLWEGRAIAFFFLGFLGSFSHGTLPDFGQCGIFFVVFHDKMSDRFSLMAGQIHDKMSENPWQNEWKSSPGGYPGTPLGPKVCKLVKRWENGANLPLPGEGVSALFAQFCTLVRKKANFEWFVGVPVRNPLFCRKITGQRVTKGWPRTVGMWLFPK